MIHSFLFWNADGKMQLMIGRKEDRCRETVIKTGGNSDGSCYTERKEREE